MSMLYERLTWAIKNQDNDYFGYGHDWENEMVQLVAWRAQLKANQCFEHLSGQQQTYIVTKDPQVNRGLKFIYHGYGNNNTSIK